MFETFWKSDGSAVWMYTEIPEDKRYKLFICFYIFWEKSIYQFDIEWSVVL
jgi:hypothetical protein